jgi:uncharacterized protein YbjT (DUF2867 family)
MEAIMSNKILVLGATGNIGSFLVQYLKGKGAHVTGAAPADEQGKIKKAGVPGVTVELGDRYELEKVMKGFDSLFMLLPLAEPMAGWADNILEAAKRAGIRFILRSSLIDANSSSTHYLFKVHGQIDDKVRKSGIEFSITHPNNFMQNFAVYYAGAINSTNTLSLNFGNAKVSSVDVRDIAASDAEILLNTGAHHGKEYTLTGPQGLTMGETAGLLSAAAGRKITYNDMTDEAFEKALHGMGMSDWDVKAMASLGPHVREGLQSKVTYDVERLSQKKPIFFEEFAHDYAGVWQKVPAGVH